jgi:hypothetical protein
MMEFREVSLTDQVSEDKNVLRVQDIFVGAPGNAK